jgi:hypothetical protein
MLWQNQNKSWILYGFISVVLFLLIFIFAVFLMTPSLLVEYANSVGLEFM